MAKQPFRSIGQRLHTFAHSHIRNYVSSGNVVSRVELPPSWQQNVNQPLVWRDDDAPVLSGEQSSPEAEALQTPPHISSVASQLQRILAAHETRQAQETPSNAPAADNNPPPPVQREAEPSEASQPQPRPMPKRRRGAVIEVPSQSAPSSAEEDTPPDFFFLNDQAPEDNLQRAPEVETSPAPSSRPPQPAPVDDSETSFWRELFTPGSETPDISTERADEGADFAAVTDVAEDSSPESYVEPVSAGEAPPAVTPPVQRDMEQSPTFAEETYVPTNYEADLPAGAEIAPSTSDMPPVVQRQTAEQNTPQLQRHTIEEDFISEPDYPAETFMAAPPEQTADLSEPAVSPQSEQREAPAVSQQSTGQGSTDIQREIDQPSEPIFSPPMETSAQDAADVVTPSTDAPPSVQRQMDSVPTPDWQYQTEQENTPPSFTHEPDLTAVEPDGDEPAMASSVSAPETSVVQRQIEPEAIEDVFYSMDEPTADSTEEVGSDAAFVSPLAQTATPSVQREVSQSTDSHIQHDQASSDVWEASQPDTTERAQIDQPTPVQRSVDEPAAFSESQPTSEWQDALTMLTPAPEPPPVQRTTSSPPEMEPSEPEYTGADAPTMVTEAAPVPSTPTVQREMTDEPAPEAKPTVRMPEVPPSPWTDFMNPAPRKSERIKRPAPPTIVQRAPETDSTSEPTNDAPAEYHAPQDETLSLPEQPIDLLTALMDAGAVNTPPQISRRSEQESSGFVSQPPAGTEIPGASLERNIPDEGSVDAELLSLIDLPPTTPIIRQAQSEPSVSRAVERSHDSGTSEPTSVSLPPMIEQHAEPLDTLMLDRGAATPSSSVSTGTEGEGKSGDDGVDVDKLARDVMGVLRRRLRNEQERHGGNS